MSIYGSVNGHADIDIADAYLYAEKAASLAMRDAAAKMLAMVAMVGKDTPTGKNYDKTHKRMVKVIREWEQITMHGRERG